MIKSEVTQYLREYINTKKQYESDVSNEQRLISLINHRKRKPEPPKQSADIAATIFTIAVLAIPIAIALCILCIVIFNIMPSLGDPISAYFDAHPDNTFRVFVKNHDFLGPVLTFYIPGLIASFILTIESKLKKSKRSIEQYNTAIVQYERGLAEIPQLERNRQIAAMRTVQSRQKLKALEQ